MTTALGILGAVLIVCFARMTMWVMANGIYRPRSPRACPFCAKSPGIKGLLGCPGSSAALDCWPPDNDPVWKVAHGRDL